MYPESFTTEKFQQSLKIRKIWFNNLKIENLRIKSMLVDAFYPYQILLRQECMHIYDNDLYELDSYICIKDKSTPSTSVGNLFGYETEPYIELNLYLIPTSSNSSYKSPQLSLFADEKVNFERLINKFSKEINMEVIVIYG